MKKLLWFTLSTSYFLYAPHSSNIFHHNQMKKKIRFLAGACERIKARRRLPRNYSILAHIPGFKSTLKAYLTHAGNEGAKGYLFEIEAAVECMKNKKATLCAMNQQIECPLTHIQRQIDLILKMNSKDEIWIECKNRNWQTLHKKKQFIDQKKIAQAKSVAEKRRIIYAVYSKTPVPPKWRNWFRLQEIIIAQNAQ